MKKILYILFLFFGISCLLGSYSVYQNTKIFLAQATKSSGRVIEVVQNENKKFAPKIRFHSPQEDYEVIIGQYKKTPTHEVGEVIPIVYERANPYGVKINYFLSLYIECGIFLSVGLFLCGFCCFKLWRTKKSTPQTIRVFTTQNCAYCKRVKEFFTSLKIPFLEIDLEKNNAFKEKLFETYSWRSVPMVFIGEEFVGGCDDVLQLHKEKKLLQKIHTL